MRWQHPNVHVTLINYSVANLQKLRHSVYEFKVDLIAKKNSLLQNGKVDTNNAQNTRYVGFARDALLDVGDDPIRQSVAAATTITSA